MPFVRINGVLLHYRLAGPKGAPAVVLINSLGTDARIWDALIAELEQSYCVLSYDKRGHGLSDAPPGNYGLDDHLDDLEGLIAHAGFQRVALVGVSVGGLIAQGLALRAPSLPGPLVLCCTAPRMGEAAMWNERIRAVLEGGLAGIADAVMERWFSPGFRRDEPDALAGWRNLFVRTDPAGYAATCATLRDTDLRAAISDIVAPTLVLAGAADRSISQDQVEAGARAIPGARFRLLPDVGHLPPIEAPSALAGLVANFFKEVGHG